MNFSWSLVLLIAVLFENVLAVIQFTQAPSNQAALLNQALWWHCIARTSIGSPEPTYTWLYANQLISGESNRAVFSNGTLYIARVDQAVLGSYQCRVQSGVMLLESSVVTLSLASLGITFSSNPTSVTKNLGSPLNLQCSISSVPMATIMWQLNGEDVTMATNITSTESNSITSSSLHITSLEHQYGGQYRCLATNGLLTGLTRFSQTAIVTLVGRPGFSVTPQPQTVMIGGTARFQCEANGTPAATVEWLDAQNNVIQNAGRYITTTTSLVITNAQLLDGGYYTCRASNAWGDNTASALLTIADPSQQIIFTTTPMDKSVVVGERVLFQCAATGVPLPTITWSKENGELPSSRSEEPGAGWLRITNLTVGDGGFYVCTANNSLTSVSTRVQLIVHVSPSFRVRPADTIVEAGERTSLHCEVDGIPIPSLTWITPLPELGRLQISSGLQSGIEVLSNGSLVIPVVENRHAGTYACTATNPVGIASTQATVTVRSPPVITTAPGDQTITEGETARFECRAAANPTPIITWRFNGRQLTTDFKYEVIGNGDLRINNVEMAQEGVYTCSAGNILGMRNVSVYLTVNIPPRITVYPDNMIADPGSNIVLNCQASGDPKPSIQWRKDGSPLILESNIEILSNSTIVISGLMETNTGEYTCVATNPAGQAFMMATIAFPDIPRFARAPRNTTGNETYPVTIQCRAEARETPRISWYLSDSLGALGNQIGLGINPPTTRAGMTIVSVAGDLEFGQVFARDEGWYLCVAENSCGNVSSLAYLSVNVPPHITSTNSPQNIREGSSFVLLSCGFSGQPQPEVTWLMPDGQPVVNAPGSYSTNIQSSIGFLVVYNPTVSDNDGDFTCSVANFLGSDNVTVKLVVEGPPVLTKVQATTSGTILTLQCMTKGSPAPDVVWRRGATELPDPSVLQHTTTTEGTLVISNLTAAESGVYTCTAENIYGSTFGILRAPSQMSTPIIGVITSTSIEVSWTPPPDSGDLPITAYIVQYLNLDTNEYSSGGETGELSLDVSGLQPYTAYLISVQARNGLGRGLFSIPTSRVITAEAVPSIPRNVTAMSAGNLVTVTWTAPARLNGDPANIEYAVTYKPRGSEMEASVLTVSHYRNALTALLADLDYVTEYEINVRAGNTRLQEWSLFSSTLVMTGYQAPILAIQGFQASANSSTSIWLTWKMPNDSTFEAYLIYYREMNSSDFSPDIVLTVQSSTSYVIIGLDSGTQYGVGMAYQNAGGLSPFTREVIVTTPLAAEPSVGSQTIAGGVIAAIVCGILVVILLLALVSFFFYWKRKNDTWMGQRNYNVDSMWINRSGGSQKGGYDVSLVNENYAPDETGLSSDSAYDLGGGGGAENPELSPRSDSPEAEDKKRKKRRWRGISDVIYKNPDNPGVVLVSKAMIGDTYPPPVAVNKDEVLSDDEAETTMPSPLHLAPDRPASPENTYEPPIQHLTPTAEDNLYVEMGGLSELTEIPDAYDNMYENMRGVTEVDAASPQSDGDKSLGLSAEFLVFPNADDSIKLSEELHVDPKMMRKMERKAERDQEKKAKRRSRQEERERQKEREKEEREWDKKFGRRFSGGLVGRFFKRRNSDEIPYPDTSFAISTERQVENAGMF